MSLLPLRALRLNAAVKMRASTLLLLLVATAGQAPQALARRAGGRALAQARLMHRERRRWGRLPVIPPQHRAVRCSCCRGAGACQPEPAAATPPQTLPNVRGELASAWDVGGHGGQCKDWDTAEGDWRNSTQLPYNASGSAALPTVAVQDAADLACSKGKAALPQLLIALEMGGEAASAWVAALVDRRFASCPGSDDLFRAMIRAPEVTDRQTALQ